MIPVKLNVYVISPGIFSVLKEIMNIVPCFECLVFWCSIYSIYIICTEIIADAAIWSEAVLTEWVCTIISIIYKLLQSDYGHGYPYTVCNMHSSETVSTIFHYVQQCISYLQILCWILKWNQLAGSIGKCVLRSAFSILIEIICQTWLRWPAVQNITLLIYHRTRITIRRD